MNEKFLYMNPSPQILTGKAMAVFPDGQPVLTQLTGNPSYWVPVFDSPEPLKEWLAANGIKEYKLKKIDNGIDFVRSLEEQGVRIMLNPRVVKSPEGPKTRWTEIVSEKNARNVFPVLPPSVN